MRELILGLAKPRVNSLHENSDEELVKRAQAGSPAEPGAGEAGPDAVCKLYDRYHTSIFRFLWSRLPDRQTAEDLTGEVFVRMVRSLPGFRPSGAPFKAWLFRIARNLLIDHYRVETPKQALPLDEAEYTGSEAHNPAQTIEGKQFIEKVRIGLQRLQPDQQEIIILRFMIGLSLHDVAALLGKTIGAVKIAQHRGLVELRSTLGDMGSEGEDEQ